MSNIPLSGNIRQLCRILQDSQKMGHLELPSGRTYYYCFPNGGYLLSVPIWPEHILLTTSSKDSTRGRGGDF